MVTYGACHGNYYSRVTKAENVKVLFFICKYQFYSEAFRISKCILLVWEELKEVNANFRYIITSLYIRLKIRQFINFLFIHHSIAFTMFMFHDLIISLEKIKSAIFVSDKAYLVNFQ